MMNDADLVQAAGLPARHEHLHAVRPLRRPEIHLADLERGLREPFGLGEVAAQVGLPLGHAGVDVAHERLADGEGGGLEVPGVGLQVGGQAEQVAGERAEVACHAE